MTRRRTSSDHDFTDASRGPRIQKILAEAGVGSRRACEELIERGEVSVNGHLVTTLPAFVDPARDVIKVGSRKVSTAAPPVYVMLHKPRHVVCTNHDPEGRKRAVDLVKHPSRVRLYPVGRLDMDSTGLLLLTNDGELANRLTHPSHGVHKNYEVTVKGELTGDEVKRIERGVFLTDTKRGGAARTRRSRLRVLHRDRDRTHLLIELREGRNRQIRRVMARLGHPVKKLRRVQLGPLKLKDLQPGQWRELLPAELGALRKAAQIQDNALSSTPPAARPAGNSRKKRSDRQGQRGTKAPGAAGSPTGYRRRQ